MNERNINLARFETGIGVSTIFARVTRQLLDNSRDIGLSTYRRFFEVSRFMDSLFLFFFFFSIFLRGKKGEERSV